MNIIDQEEGSEEQEDQAAIDRAILASMLDGGDLPEDEDDSDVVSGEEEEVTGEEVLPAKKLPERKTKQQKTKAARLRAEKRTLAEKALRKHMLHTLSSTSLKSLRTSGLHKSTLASQRHAASREKLREKLRTQGLKGKRLGKHWVPEGDVDVQLGEDLSESLRELKPEGNLFRDRFQSLQQRALVEPRIPVLPTKRKFKVKEYEKHAWKRFE